MKKFLILLLTLTLILGVFASCGQKIVSKEEPSKETTTANAIESSDKTTDKAPNVLSNGNADTSFETDIEYPEDYTYTIKKIDGKWYMDFDSYVTPTVSIEGSIMEMEFPFDSFEDMFNTIIVDKSLIKEEKIYLIDHRTKTEYGIEIINFDDLYVPVMPSSLKTLSVYWFTKEYGTVVADKSSGVGTGRITYRATSKDFDDKYNELVWDENNYVLTEGDKIVIVEKIQFEDSFDIDLYIKQGDRYCYVNLFNMTESPADEFFLQFGLEKWEKPE